MCLMIIKKAIPEAFRGTISETIKTTEEFLEEIKNRFAKNEKSKTSTLLENLISMRYKGNGNIREYIMEMSHLASKLRAHKLDLSEDLLVHLVLISLPTQFSQFKVSYNCQNETWSLNELISHCVQEEERLKQEKIESAHLTGTSKDYGKKRKKDKEAAEVPYQKKQHKEKRFDGCFFCGAVGHKKKQCTNYHAWRAKKGTLLNLVFSEVNLTSVPKHTWWIDSGPTTHISVSMQGYLSCRNPNDGERYIFVGDGKKVKVEAIKTFRLFLKSGTYLNLNETYVVPSFRRNLVSISILDKFGYTCSFGNNKFSLFQNSNLVGTCSLSYVDNLYMLDTIASYHETLQLSTQGVKRKLTDENSSSLWHKRLGLISKRRIERLVSDGILDSLDFADFEICTICIKGKQTNTRRFGANRATNVLQLIHTNICGPFPTVSWNDQQYFITFIDDFSHYDYLYLILEKSQSLEVFKSFKVEVENQLNKMIKNVRSNRGGEYYGKYDGSGEQRPGTFAKFLEECGIVPQYTMPGSPSMNGVAERRNRTLKDMVRSLISHSNLPISL